MHIMSKDIHTACIQPLPDEVLRSEIAKKRNKWSVLFICGKIASHYYGSCPISVLTAAYTGIPSLDKQLCRQSHQLKYMNFKHVNYFPYYRSGTVNSKFHLIRSFFEYLARFLSFHV